MHRNGKRLKPDNWVGKRIRRAYAMSLSSAWCGLWGVVVACKSRRQKQSVSQRLDFLVRTIYASGAKSHALSYQARDPGKIDVKFAAFQIEDVYLMNRDVIGSCC